MWSIESPYNKHTIKSHVSNTRSDAIKSIELSFGEKWKPLYRRGFRAVKVKIIKEPERLKNESHWTENWQRVK